MRELVFLNDIWVFYFHDPFETDWTNGSYVLLSTISTVQDWWHNYNCVSQHIEKGIFFLMRDGVFPCWDDPENIDGGVISIKILKERLPEFWEFLTINLLGENLNENWRNINGVSTSPKKTFSICKIWLKNDEYVDIKKFDILHDLYHGEAIYKSNRENISNENCRLSQKITL